MKMWILSMLVATSIYSVSSAADEMSGCFTGQDQLGATTRMALRAERIGDYFEIFGQVMSPNIGVMKIKADGWSGAGRMYYQHEYESGAYYIKISNYSASGLLLEVKGFGHFPFYTSAC